MGNTAPVEPLGKQTLPWNHGLGERLVAQAPARVSLAARGPFERQAKAWRSQSRKWPSAALGQVGTLKWVGKIGGGGGGSRSQK